MAQIGISISDDALGELKDSNLNINVSPSDYLDEQYTLNYINNVFKNLDDVTKK